MRSGSNYRGQGIMFTSLLTNAVMAYFLTLLPHSSGEVKLEDIEKLSAFCTDLNKEAYCTEQCTNMHRMAVQRICQDRRLSKTYIDLIECEHAKAGVCRWFRCRCSFNPTDLRPNYVSLGYCKKTLLKYFKENEELGTLGFEEL